MLRRNPRLGRDLARLSDIELADRLLAPHEFAYSVSELALMLERSALSVRAFVPGILYDPTRMLREPKLRECVSRLDPIRRAQIAENLQGDMNKHVFYAVRAGNPAMSVEAMLDRGGDAVRLLPRQMSGREVAAGVRDDGTVSLGFVVDGTERHVTIQASHQVRHFLEALDAEPTVGELRAHVGGTDPDATIRYMVRVLSAIEALHLALP